MRSKSIVAILIVALILAAGATVMVMLYLERSAARAQAGPLLVPVVVSTQDLSFGSTLDESKLKVAMFPKESVPKGAVSKVDSIVGQTNKVFLAQDEPVLVSKLSAIGGGLSLMIEPTLRAVSISVDKVSGVSGFVLPGDRVDVITIIDQVGKSRDRLAKTILQNVEVLAAGEKTEKRGNEPIKVQSVTLLVDPEGSEKLALAQNEGKLHLALRNPNDLQMADETEGLTKKELLEGPKKEVPKPKVVYRYRDRPVPKEEPAKPDTLTIIRGRDASKEKPAMNRSEPDDTTNTSRGE